MKDCPPSARRGESWAPPEGETGLRCLAGDPAGRIQAAEGSRQPLEGAEVAEATEGCFVPPSLAAGDPLTSEMLSLFSLSTSREPESRSCSENRGRRASAARHPSLSPIPHVPVPLRLRIGIQGCTHIPSIPRGDSQKMWV